MIVQLPVDHPTTSDQDCVLCSTRHHLSNNVTGCAVMPSICKRALTRGLVKERKREIVMKLYLRGHAYGPCALLLVPHASQAAPQQVGMCTICHLPVMLQLALTFITIPFVTAFCTKALLLMVPQRPLQWLTYVLCNVNTPSNPAATCWLCEPC